MTEELFRFRKFYSGEDNNFVEQCNKAALEKLHTLFPGRRVTIYDYTTIAIDSDSVYCTEGFDTYELGMINDEIPAMQRTSDNNIITFRI